ncbi:MAG TPA: ABC-2 family transporter protein [Abditibacteriaceae bacterium]|jgi:ABC-2 type transport system permease protein
MKKYWSVALLGWQDSLAYRFNALVWVLYAVLPSLTLMFVWLAVYEGPKKKSIAGLDLPAMMTYYLAVTALSVAITPNFEWETMTQIREGKITGFIVRPIGFFGYRMAQETSYQIIKTAMMLPAFALLVWAFRDYVRIPPMSFGRILFFILSAILAYILLTQIKFMLAISAFWLAEAQGFLEIWHILMGVFAGRLLPLALLPRWLQSLGGVLPFSLMYAFPLDVLLKDLTLVEIGTGFARQLLWISVLAVGVRVMWRRGLLAYEAYGG